VELNPIAMEGAAVTPQRLDKFRVDVQTYVSAMREEFMGALDREAKRVDGLYASNLSMRVYNMEQLGHRVIELEGWKTAQQGNDDQVKMKVGLDNHTADLALLKAKLEAYEVQIQNTIQETRDAVNKLAVLESDFQQVSALNFGGIREEFNLVRANVETLALRIGEDRRTTEQGQQGTVFEKANALYEKYMGLEVKVTAVEAKLQDNRCHCEHVETLLNELEKFRSLARAGALGPPGMGGAGSSAPSDDNNPLKKNLLSEMYLSGKCPHCHHVDDLLRLIPRVAALEHRAAQG